MDLVLLIFHCVAEADWSSELFLVLVVVRSKARLMDVDLSPARRKSSYCQVTTFGDGLMIKDKLTWSHEINTPFLA